MHMVSACSLARHVSLGQMTATIGAHAPLVGASSFANVPGAFDVDGLGNAVAMSRGRRAFFANGAAPSSQPAPISNGNSFERRLTKVIEARTNDLRVNGDEESGTAKSLTRLLTPPPSALLRHILRIDPNILEPKARHQHWLAQAKEFFKEARGDLKEEELPEQIRETMDTLMMFDWSKARPDFSVIHELEDYLEVALDSMLKTCWAAYGDWLVQNNGGGVDQGFIRGHLIQFEMARSNGNKGDKTQLEEQELLRKQYEEELDRSLRGRLGMSAGSVTCKRRFGYLYEIELVEPTMSAIKELFESEDAKFLRSVSLVDISDEFLEGFLEIRSISNLEKLDLRSGFPYRKVAEQLRYATHLANLRELHIENYAIVPAEAKHLRYATHFTHLRKLSLDNLQLEAEGVKHLRYATHLAGLRELHLLECELGPDAAEHLRYATHLAGLRVLNLARNDLGPAGAEHLRYATHLTNLRELDLGGNDIGPAGAEHLRYAAHLANLRELDLGSNHIGPEGAEHLRYATHLASVRVLALDSNNLGPEGAEHLRYATHLAGLRELDLWGNHIGPDGAEHLRYATHLAGLRVLKLTANGLGLAGAEHLMNINYLRNSVSLKLDEYGIPYEQIEQLKRRFEKT